MNDDNLLCYEMNGVPLPPEHGAPVRLIAPGWYGVANVKWLVRIEVTDRRFAGRFMARDYVTIREDTASGQHGLDLHERRHARAQVGAGQGDPSRQTDTRSSAPHGALRSPRCEVQIDDGPWTRRSSTRHRSRDRRLRVEVLVAELGDSRRRASTRSAPGRIDGTATSNQPPTIRPSPAGVTYWENNGQITRRVLIA